MSLFSTIQLAHNSLTAAQIGIQVSGNNIANADTPGYIRQEAPLTEAPTVVRGKLPFGLGVRVAGIVQNIDRFLSERLRNAIADAENSGIQEQLFLELESVLGELGETDLSTSLTDFFGSIHDVLNQPEDLTVRNQAVLRGEQLVDGIRRLDSRASELRTNVNERIESSAGEINQLLERISRLNGKIVELEAGTPGSHAVGLRDQRELSLAELAGLIGSRSVESENGSVSVVAGGELLVSGQLFQPVAVKESLDGGSGLAEIVIERSDAALDAPAGKLAGLYAARDEILGGFLDQLQEFAGALAFEFNRVYSRGQGLSGFTDLTAAHVPDDEAEPLDQAGLAGPPVNGSFQLLVRNSRSGLVETTDVLIHLNGLEDDTSLADLAESLDAIEGISAEITAGRELRITTDSADTEFSFANDTSGVLASLGLNVFFTGSTAGDVAISQVLQSDPGKFAASLGGVGHDGRNAEELAAFADLALSSRQGNSITDLYEAMVLQTTQASAVRRAVTDGLRVFQRTLESQHLATTGVSIDDEAVKILTQQRMYQASARVISSIAELLDTLINL